MQEKPLTLTVALECIEAYVRCEAGSQPPTHKHLELLLKELDSLKAQQEWRPIETAPLDGTPVDLWCEEGIERFRLPDCMWRADGWYTNRYHKHGYGKIFPRCIPLFWRARPTPPFLPGGKDQ